MPPGLNTWSQARSFRASRVSRGRRTILTWLLTSMSKAASLLAVFSDPDYYLSESSVREAVERRSMFNLLAFAEGDKVDFWLLTSEPFDRSRFERRRIVDVSGMKLKVSTPEDTILAKL